MNPSMVQLVVFVGLLILVTPVAGWWLYSILERKPTFLDRVLGPMERLIYRITGVEPDVEMRWTHYALSLLAFNTLGIVVLFAQLRLQGVLPLNPEGAAGMPTPIALNTAVSFVTNTNWQTYAGEVGASTLSQMAGLALQQFLSAATGICVGAALIRGIVRDASARVGNFWVDLTRSWLYVLLPVSILLAFFYVGQGCVQSLSGPTEITTLEGVTQTLPLGPVASMEAIKELGTNGGGYFNANSAHPFEGPTPLSIYVEMIAILAIPAGFTWMFGRAAGDARQGWVVFSAMLLLFAATLAVTYAAEKGGTRILREAGADQAETALQAGGNMEGKETRFGVAETALYGTVTTAASNGAVVGMHDSFTPLGGGALLFNILLGEVVFGGVGVGLAGMLVYAILAVFIAGLMVGRSPEYVGKKIETRDVRMALFAVLAIALAILIPSAISTVVPAGLEGPLNAGPHGFSEILYAHASAAGNNGSAFAGLGAASTYYALLSAAGMWIGRFLFIVPVLAIAGGLSAKRRMPPSQGTLPTGGALFAGLLVGVVVVVGALTFFPALSLGPVVEHLLMNGGGLF